MSDSDDDYDDLQDIYAASTAAEFSLTFPHITSSTDQPPLVDENVDEDSIDYSSNAAQRSSIHSFYQLPFNPALNPSHHQTTNDPFDIESLESEPVSPSTHENHVIVGPPQARLSVSEDEWFDGLKQFAPRIDLSIVDQNIIDWLITQGYGDVADCMERETGVKPSIDDPKLEARMSIRDSILDGDILDAIDQIRSIDEQLVDSTDFQPYLFVLYIQHIIELICNNDSQSAFDFARNTLACMPMHHEIMVGEFERVMSLFAYHDPINQSPDADLFDYERLEDCAACINTLLLELDKRSPVTSLDQVVTLMNEKQQTLISEHTFPRLILSLNDPEEEEWSDDEYEEDSIPDFPHSPLQTPVHQPIESQSIVISEFDLHEHPQRHSVIVPAQHIIQEFVVDE